jgi:phospholipid transport system substrate-binding protein
MRAWFTLSCLRSSKAWLGAALAVLVAVSLAKTPADARPASLKGDQAAEFMDKVGRDLLAGARAKSPLLLSNAVKRYGDVASIGQYSLGSYRAKLPASDRPIYYRGMVAWMGKYAASKVPEYPVTSYQILRESYPYKDGVGVLVDTRIVLRSGQSYDVTWLLQKYGGSYRVRDANVMGLWMTPFLKNLFEQYIGQNGGDVKALVATLNAHVASR